MTKKEKRLVIQYDAPINDRMEKRIEECLEKEKWHFGWHEYDFNENKIRIGYYKD